MTSSDEQQRNAKRVGTPSGGQAGAARNGRWNEVKFNIAYGSDLEFVARTMEEAVAEEIGDEMIERVREYREILAKTPVDEIEVQEKPVVLFRVSDNTWIEVIVRYLVDPIQAGPVKTRLLQNMLPRLNAAQDRVMFPRGDAR
jgi:small-conductance mechanosensitive channel